MSTSKKKIRRFVLKRKGFYANVFLKDCQVKIRLNSTKTINTAISNGIREILKRESSLGRAYLKAPLTTQHGSHLNQFSVKSGDE